MANIQISIMYKYIMCKMSDILQTILRLCTLECISNRTHKYIQIEDIKKTRKQKKPKKPKQNNIKKNQKTKIKTHKKTKQT